MKRLLLLVALLGVVLTACDGKDDELGENKKPLPELPALPDPEDVCTAMDDIHFMAYCYRTFDVNNDGKVSVSEANAVMKIDLSDFAEKAEIVSLKGIEYFVNLQFLVCTKCAKLAALDLRYNKKMTAVEPEAFSECSELCRIALPDGVTEIGYYAFSSCFSLTDIVIPDSVTEIGCAAFDGCDSLLSVTCKAIEPPSIGVLWWNSYFKVPTLYVPKNSVAAYKSSNWGNMFQEIKPIE